jgi:hypothetical protein
MESAAAGVFFGDAEGQCSWIMARDGTRANYRRGPGPDAGQSEGNGHEALAPDATSGLVAADSAAGRPSPAPSPTVPVATPWPSLEQGLEARLSGVG